MKKQCPAAKMPSTKAFAKANVSNTATKTGRVTRLESFAKKHNLEVKTIEDRDCDTLKPFSTHVILFEDGMDTDAAIFDPQNDYTIRKVFQGSAKLKRQIKMTRVRAPLAITIFAEQNNRLFELIGFDVPNYYNGGGDNPDDPTSTEWGRVLDKLGIKYFDGDDLTITFLFGSSDSAASTMVLALARLGTALPSDS